MVLFDAPTVFIAEAVKWIRKAAEQGSEPAKEYLEKLGN